MSNKIYSIKELKNIISKILSDFSVEKAILFGSYAKGEADCNSDIDLVIDSNDTIQGIEFYKVLGYLQEGLGKEVDLIDQVEIINNGEIDREIKKTGMVIYEK